MEPENNSDYLQASYWEQRYTNEESHEWLLNFDQLRSDILGLLDQSQKLLIIGCGNSGFSEKLYDAGFKNITNIDISQTVVMKMSHKNQDRAEMQWIQMDMLNMEFEENTFDVCIDKATMDVLQCDNEDAWSPSIEVRERVSLFYGNCYRVLKPNGKIIQISFDQPHFRKIYINEFNRFSVTVRTINSGSLPYFIYVLDKKENC